jgi:CheY-like chemotaxis protein
MKLLIVEDNQAVRRLLKSVLEGLASEVFECEDGGEALAVYARHQPDWVLMDVKMKRLDGLAATRQIRAVYPEARIVIVTSHNDEELHAEAVAAGAYAFVLKKDLWQLRSLIATA